MKPLLILGKIITLLAWLLMIGNFISPLAPEIATLLIALFWLTLVMHGLQTFIFHKLFKSLLPLTKLDYLQVFIFGIFSLLHYRQQVISTTPAQQ